MRLLLDEMYPAAIAVELRRRHHDVEAVVGRADLRALADGELFEIAQAEMRAIVTENVADFSLLADRCDESGGPHHGLVLVAPATYPRGSTRTIGRMVTVLDDLLHGAPAGAPSSARRWL